MKGLDLGALKKALTKNKYVLLVLCAGLALLLLPKRGGVAESASAEAQTHSAGTPMAASGIPLDAECGRIASLLRAVRGVGSAEVLLSAEGCVVVCEGADSAAVRLNVTNAVTAYTGLGSDKICVLKKGIGDPEISGGNAK